MHHVDTFATTTCKVLQLNCTALLLAAALRLSCPDTGSALQIYKDSNHKPEMALAITDFEALCGFDSVQELSDAVCSILSWQQL